MRPDGEPMEALNRLEAKVAMLESRMRALEARLRDRAITIGDKKGVTRRLRLGDKNTLEVE